MVFPLSCLHLSRSVDFFTFAVSLAFEPYAFEIRAVGIDFSQVTIRMAIFENALLDTTIVPAFAADTVFFAYNW